MGFEGLTTVLGDGVPWNVVWIWAFKSAAILAAAFVLDRLLGQATAALRHRVWAFAFGLVLLIPAADLWLPGLPVLPDLRTPVATALEVPIRVVAPQPPGTTLEPSTAAGQGRESGLTSRNSTIAPRVGPAVGVAPVTEAGPRGRNGTDQGSELGPQGFASGLVAGMAPRETSSLSVPNGAGWASTVSSTGAGEPKAEAAGLSGTMILGLVWLSGLLTWFLGLAVGLRRAQRRYRNGWEPQARIQRNASEIAADLGLKRVVPVRIGAVDVPAAWGWRRPRILLPPDAEQWPADRVRRVLTHEMAHVRRRDWPLTLVAEAVRALHWYNPLAWAGLARMRVERERACDDVVLSRGARASDYAMDLLEVARGPGGAFAVAPVMALGRKHRLAGRIDDLLDAGRRRVEGRYAGPLSGGMFTIVFGSLALLTVAAGGVPADEAPAPALTVQVSDAPAPSVDPEGMAVPVSPPEELREETESPEPNAPAEGTDRPFDDVRPIALPDARLLIDQPRRLALLQQAIPVCNWDRGSGRGRSMQTNVDDDGDWRIRWRTPECETEIWLEGDVVFNDTEDGVASMGRGARFEVRERQEGIRRRLVAESDGGVIRYRFWRNGDETEFDEAGRRWFETFLPQLFRQTTLQAEERVARIFERGGTDAVLAEVGRMHSDHVAARYLELLMNQSGFQPEEVPEVLDLVAELMDSDHYVAGILEAVGERWGIRPEYEENYVRAVAGLESDHYAHGALVALLRDGMSDGMVGEILAASRFIESDHYKADLLTRMARAEGIGPTDRAAYLQAFASVESDHYQHSIVMALLDNGTPDEAELAQILALLDTVESDHYRADILTRIGRDHPLAGAGVEAFLQAAHGIESDHYASEVGRVLVRRADLQSGQIDLVLDIAQGINGDHGRAELMRALIREHALSPAQRDRYRELALGIDSRHLQDQLLAELVR